MDGDSVIGENANEVHQAGLPAGAGSFICMECELPVSLTPGEEIPTCANCGGRRFRRASIFEQPTLTNVSLIPDLAPRTEWLEEVRAEITEPGKYLVVFADGRKRVIRLEAGWSRIGRSRSADIRLDDPTVSRRHAVVVQTPEGELRCLDDRSLNGIFVNEEQVDWSPLSDGDTLQIGRYTLHVIETAGAAAEPDPG
jgi:DNA-directed RNA polymerase subunit RPC12/RpoP